jgi:D-alanyl-D-alanine carboxypeptidase (penicillin-binding protein 5/6)
VRRGVALLIAGALGAGAAAPTAPAAAAAPPPVIAPAAILVAPQTGDVLFRRDADVERPVASTTKLMTALLVRERVSLGDTFTAVPYSAAAAESKLGLHPGERMTVRDLLTALLVASANDAAQTLAVGTAGSVPAFVSEMNARAQALGLRHTHYANPVGLDEPGNYSSAADLARLAEVLRGDAFVRRTVALPRARLASGDHPRTIANRNDLVGNYRIVTGVKTGHTDAAGYVLVGSGTRAGVDVVSVVIGDPSQAARDADTLALLRYGLDQYRRVPIVLRDRVLASARVRYREDDRIQLVAARTVVRVLRRGERPAIAVRAARRLEGPLPAGARAGTITVRLRGRVVDRVPLVTAAPVPKVGWAERALDFAFKPGTLAVLLLLVAGGVGVGLLVRRRRAAAQVGGEAT